jgi:DNA-binding CsgD family transcriptional regulator
MSRQGALITKLKAPNLVQDQCGTWSSEQLKELWKLRYERKPKYTYDQLMKKFKVKNSWDIVNTLCLLQNRQRAGIDMWTPLEGKPRPEPTKPVIVKQKRKPYKLDEKTQDYIRLHGAGYSNREIAELYGCTRENVRKRIHKVEKERADEYARLFAEGQKQKRPERS